MSERKYTEEQIVKALECCRDFGDCSLCPYENATFADELDCTEKLHTDALALINRQKAEIERLADRSHKCIYLSDEESMEYCVDGPCPHYKTEAKIKAEAIKEFAERLKKRYSSIPMWGTVAVAFMEDVIKEVTEGE